MSTYKVTLTVKDSGDQYGDAATLEHYLVDLLAVAVLPALDLELTHVATTEKRG